MGRSVFLKRKLTTKRKLLSLGAVFLVCAVLVFISVRQAAKLAHIHAEMLSFVNSIPSDRLDQFESRYQGGYSFYYSLSNYSGIYAVDQSDTLYEKLEMERWAVEVSGDSSGSIRILVPVISWNPQYVDFKKEGWFLSGGIGSSITLTNPRLDPKNNGRLWLEVVDRDSRGVVFVIGQGRAGKSSNVL